MTGLEFYLKKNLGLKDEDPALKEIINYLVYEGYEVIFDKTAREKNMMHTKKNNSTCQIRNNNNEEYELLIETFDEELGIERTTLIDLDKDVKYPRVIDEINGQIKTIFSLTKGEVLMNGSTKKLNLNALLHLKEELLQEGIYLKLLMHELDKETKKTWTKSSEKTSQKQI